MNGAYLWACLFLALSAGIARAQTGRPFEGEMIERAEGYREGAEESEEAPGLLGYALHGRGGIAVEHVYTGDVFTNMRGGLNTNNATEYRGNFDLMMTADLDEMGLAPGGTIFLYGQNGHGRGITERHVGDFQVLSNIDTHDFMQVSEYWWERSLLDGLLRVRLGKQDCNADFACVKLSLDFINSSFGFHPTIPMPTFPDPSMAVVTFFQITDWLSFNVGVWDGVPDGRNWGFSGTGVTFSIYEFRAKYDLWDGLPGEIHGAGWYHSGQWDDLASGLPYAGNRGFHCAIDQMIVKEHPYDEDDEQGLGVFAQYS